MISDTKRLVNHSRLVDLQEPVHIPSRFSTVASNVCVCVRACALWNEFKCKIVMDIINCTARDHIVVYKGVCVGGPCRGLDVNGRVDWTIMSS